MSATLIAVPSADTTSYRETRDPFLFKRLQTWWLLLALFLIAQGNGILSEQPKHYTLKALNYVHDTGTLLPLTIAWVLISTGLILKHIGPMLRMMLKQKPVLAFAVLALVSTLWSQVPLQTSRKAVLLSVLFALAWFVAAYYSPADQMRLILGLGVIVALTSTAWALLLPQYGVSARGDWKGVFGQKNHLGIAIVFLFAGLLFCRISSLSRLLRLTLQGILPLSLIFLSQSRTSWILTVVPIAVRVFGPLMTRLRRQAIPFALYCVGFAIVLIPASLALILPMMGRDLTLTGRAHEWPIIFHFALKHPWFGYGYQGFWIGNSGDSGSVVTILRAGQNAADNGYLELMLQFGLVGIGLLVVMTISCFQDFLGLFRRSSVPLIAYWYVALILATYLGSFTESLFWTPSSQTTTFMFVLACAGLRNLSRG